MSIFRDFFVKEKPVFTGITRGIGGFGFGASAGVSVTPASPFTAKIVLVGGGGGGGISQGGGAGGAGGVAFFDFPITIGDSYDVRIGNGGRGSSDPSSPGLDGDYSQWTSDPGNYRVGEGGNGGMGPPGGSGGNGNEQGGSGGGGGIGASGGSGTGVPSPRQPYIFGGFNGGTGHSGPGGSGGNQGGGGGGATANGGNAKGSGTPGTKGGGDGGDGKVVPSAYLPDSFTQTDTGPQPGQFLGMLTSKPATLRRTFGGGGGGGAEHGQAGTGYGGNGGGGHGGFGSTGHPAAGAEVPPAGPTGLVLGPAGYAAHGEPGYVGRGGGGGGGGITPAESAGGGGGGGVIIIQSPVDAAITVGSIPSSYVNTYTDAGMRYHVIHADSGTTSASGSLQTGTVTFGPN